MRIFILSLLRLSILILLILPLVIPAVRRNHSITAPQTITVLVSSDKKINPGFHTQLEKKIKKQFGEKLSLEWRVYGSQENQPIQDFEELLNLSIASKGTTVIVNNGAFWGQAANKFKAALEKVQNQTRDRIWVISEGDINPDFIPASKEGYLVVSEIFMPKMNFLGEESAASVEIIGQVNPNEKMAPELILRSGDSLLSTHTLSLNADNNGIVHKIISVPVLFTRATTQILTATLNSPFASAPLNTASTSVTVAHAKTTLLHIGVGPDWSLRSLRQKLKFWPNLDLLSYYILREATSDMNIPNTQLSLIEFPAEKLFGTELPNFHGIVAENFLFDRYLNSSDSQNLVKYVKNGGRMVLQAGPLSFASLDSNIAALLPCQNKPEFDIEHKYQWEPSTVKLASSPDLQAFIKHISSHATAIKCEPKPNALVLAQTTEGHYPVLIAEPVEKGLVVTFMGGDWHTAYTQVEVKSDADRANRIELASASDGLFQWMVEFLQRRQDSGLRPPDLAGPRIYDGDRLYMLRSRGIMRMENPLHLYTNDQEIGVGEGIQFPLLDMEGVSFDRTLAEVNSKFLPTQVSDSSTSILSLHLQFDNDSASVKRPGLWPIYHGKSKDSENKANPLLFSNFPRIGKETSTGPEKETNSNLEKSRKETSTENVPLLLAYPFLLACVLALLTVEQFLVRILWPAKLNPR